MDDVQSWWEIPCIAHFCSLFRLYFNLIDFDIEELEEALLTDSDSAEEVASSLLQDLIVRLLKGCCNSQRDEVTTCNYQMYLRRLFRKKCEEGSTKHNPFDKDAAFHSLPLRTKVEILYDLCDFRLDNDDVPESLKSLEADSLRVEPLGRDSGGSTYWYFYGTRLYREDYTNEKFASGQKRGKKGKEEKVVSCWQVVCYTEEDWQVLTRKFKNCKSVHEKNLHRTLSADFLPELPRLFAEKERLQRKRMLEQQLGRTGRALLNSSEDDMPVSGKKGSSSQNGVPKSSDPSDSKMMDEDASRKQREEQEKADRLLAEEIEREERKARLHLRERRGGGGGSGFPGSGSLTSATPTDKSSTQKCNTQPKSSGSRSGSANKSPAKSSPKVSSKVKDKKKKKRKGSGRTTNNSLAASIQSVVSAKNGGKNEENDEDPIDCDEEDKDQEDGQKPKAKSRSEKLSPRSRSPSPEPPTTIKKPKKGSSLRSKRKSDDQESGDEKEKRSTSKDKSKDKKKRKLKHKDKSKDKERGKTKDKTETNQKHSPMIQLHSSGGMSKTKVKSSVIFSQSEEDVQIGMHKVIESIKNHGDAWPFMNPVDEDYAPNYYRAISSPMDLQTMEDKLDNQEYVSLEEFIADFQRIVDNCTKYNGPSSEYTEMAETLQEAFNKAVQRFIVPDESDDEINIEYNNMEVERKRPRTHSHSKKEEKAHEHKKENEPTIAKKSAPKSKVKDGDTKDNKIVKVDKKKMKHKLMRHHGRDSQAIENLDSATAETLKDINKWLGDTPKPVEYSSSSPGSLASEIRNRVPDDENDSDMTDVARKKSSFAGNKRKAITSKSPSKMKREKSDDDEDFSPPKKMFKKSGDYDKSHSKPKPKSKQEKEGRKKSGGGKSTKPKNRPGKEKQHSHHRHHKHRHSSGSSKQDFSLKVGKANGPSGKTSGYKSQGKDYRESSPGENYSDNQFLKYSKSLEDKKPKPAMKRANSLLNTLKSTGSVKRLQQVNKTPKFNSFHSESKFKPNTTETFGNKGLSNEVSAGQQGAGRDNGVLGEKPEKKKCLLLNDNPSDREGGPRLSLGTVLSTDAIKLGEFKKHSDNDDDDPFDSNISPSYSKSGVKPEAREVEQVEQRLVEEAHSDSKPISVKETKEVEKEAENEEEDETDRKLEPSKGFNREKCMPNLSAWIKAFGGPAKASSGGTPPPSRKDSESKSKFKVMGRGISDPNSNEHHHKGVKHPPVPKASKHQPQDAWNNVTPTQTPVINYMKPSEHSQVINLSEDTPSSDKHHKKNRHRKMSTSSLSSQSESGSPHCFTNQDGAPGGVGSVVNPPRWVDEHWTQAHSQSQSPSASSHVSSQSPANSPFSPAINSPPHTPQTPPRPVGPVRVGFYQDITSQHSSPEKLNEPHSNSNSNVASPSTPPTPTNSTNSSRRAENNSGSGKGYVNYPNPTYAPRYETGTPSPNVGPNSNMQSPSPGGMVNVESPGNPNSPHSPTVVNVTSVPEYRNPPYVQSAPHQSQSASSQSTGRQTPAHSSHRVSSSILGPHGSHSPAPSIAPYPPPANHYGHPSAMSQPHPENAHSGQAISQAHQPALAHMNQVQAHSQMSHQQHYDRYPPHMVHHHQLNPQSGMPSSSAPNSSYTQNLTMAHSQRPSAAHSSPYPPNPYAANPRSLNLPPNVYNNPISTDPAMNRFYKPTVSSGELSLTAGMSSSSGGSDSASPSTTSSGSHSRGRSSRSSAAAAMESDIPRSTAASLEKLGHGELNGFQWPHNLASLSQIVNSIPNPMNAVGMANAYRQYDQAMAESMSKYQRADPAGYTSLTASGGGSITPNSGKSIHPPAAHSQPADKLPTESENLGGSSRRQSSKSGESKSSRSQGGSNSKSSSQSLVAGSAFNFSSLSPADLALYPKEMSEGSLYSASPPGLAHRPDLYPTSTSNFHPSFSSAARTTAGGVPTPSIAPYQMPPFIGSHPSPYQPQSVSSQPFSHSQPPRGLTVDPYQQFFQSSPHVMGLLPPGGYPYPHGLGFNRPGWI